MTAPIIVLEVNMFLMKFLFLIPGDLFLIPGERKSASVYQHKHAHATK